MLRVAVVVDDPLARAGLVALLEAERLAVAVVLSSIAATAERFRSLAVDVVLWVVEAEQPLPLHLELPILILVPGDAEREDLPSLDDELSPLGAEWPVSVVGRAVSSQQLAAALAAVAAGLTVVQPEFAYRFAGRETEREAGESPRLQLKEYDFAVEPLSPRELEVLQLLADGLSNKVIGKRLELSEHTVKFHLNSLFDKLAVHNRTEAVSKAVRLGLIAL